jgi:hypothetical protein
MGDVIDQVIPKSIPSDTQYMTMNIQIGWRKVKTCQFGSVKWF